MTKRRMADAEGLFLEFKTRAWSSGAFRGHLTLAPKGSATVVVMRAGALGRLAWLVSLSRLPALSSSEEGALWGKMTSVRLRRTSELSSVGDPGPACTAGG